MKARLLIVMEDETLDYRQNKNGEVYEDNPFSITYVSTSMFTIDESNYSQWRREFIVQPTMTVTSVNQTDRTITLDNGSTISPASSQAQSVMQMNYEEYRRHREQQRREADERSRQAARANRWNDDDIPF